MLILEKVLKWINRLKPKRTILTHMNYEIDYDHINSLLPKNCEAAYDGLKLKFINYYQNFFFIFKINVKKFVTALIL